LKFEESNAVTISAVIKNPMTAKLAVEIKTVRMMGSCGSAALSDMGIT